MTYECVLSRFSATLWTVAQQAPLSMILQARILEWVAISFSKRSSWPRDRTQVSCIAGKFFTNWATRESPDKIIGHCETISIHLAKVMSTHLNYKLALIKSIASDWTTKAFAICLYGYWAPCYYSCWTSTTPEGVQGGVRHSVLQGI